MGRYIMQSSANMHIQDMLLGRSLIYIRNSRGPSTLPCGMREETLEREEEKLLTTVNCCLLKRKFRSQDSESSFNAVNFIKRRQWATRSNAFEKSRKMQSVCKF